MSIRRSVTPLRRLFSSTAAKEAAADSNKLPFEKPIFEARLLDKASKQLNNYKMLKFYFDVAAIALTASISARIGYYVIYGKESGAGPLPRRSESKSTSAEPESQ